MNGGAPSEIAADNELRRTLHDEVLQLLEYLSAGGYGQLVEAPQYRRIAQDAAASLRALLDGPTETGMLDEALHALANAAIPSPHPVEISFDTDDRAANFAAHALAPLIGATRESLTNALRHARADTIVLACRCEASHVTVTVDDDGCGVAPDATPGFGTTHSIIGRMREAGGETTLTRNAQGGTRVTIRQPIPEAISASLDPRSHP